MKVTVVTTLILCVVVFAAVTATLSLGQNTDTGPFKRGDVLKAEALNESIVPSSAVLAFDLAECPRGWDRFTNAEGRTIVGVGSATTDGSTRALGDRFGVERLTLGIEHLPAHSHDVRVADNNGYTGPDGTPSGAGRNDTAHELGGVWGTKDTGGGQSFDNTQPSLALLYCKKR